MAFVLYGKTWDVMIKLLIKHSTTLHEWFSNDLKKKLIMASGLHTASESKYLIEPYHTIIHIFPSRQNIVIKGYLNRVAVNPPVPSFWTSASTVLQRPTISFIARNIPTFNIKEARHLRHLRGIFQSPSWMIYVIRFFIGAPGSHDSVDD